MIFFTSDWHIGHDKPFIWQARGFSSIEEHDTEVLARCNSLVKENDELWILGDLAMGGNKEEWDRIYKNLLCKNVHFIQGNHDTDNKMDIYEDEYRFIYEGLAQIYKYSKSKIFYLSHFPTIVSNYEEYNPRWNLSGHTHSTKIDDNIQGKIYNVALDAHNCYPVSLEQILTDLKEIRRIYGCLTR